MRETKGWLCTRCRSTTVPRRAGVGHGRDGDRWRSIPAGIGYQWTVSMSGNDTTAGSTPTYTGTVGSLSWNDPINAADPIGTGWTHTSNWTALTLTDAANLSVTLAQTASPGGLGSRLLALAGPATQSAVTIILITMRGTLTGVRGGGGFLFVELYRQRSEPGALSSITKVFSLAAGQYTLVFGGNPPAGHSRRPSGVCRNAHDCTGTTPGSGLALR